MFRWLANALQRMQRQEAQYEVAMNQYLVMKPQKLAWPNGRRPAREKLYDRAGLR